MQSGVFITEQELRAFGRSVARETAKATVAEINRNGGLQEQLPDTVDNDWVAKHYNMSKSTISRRRTAIIAQFGEKGNKIFRKDGNKIYWDRKALDNWLLRRDEDKEAHKKLDPHMEV